MDQLWICRKINFQLEASRTVTMTILKKNDWLNEDEGEMCWVCYIIA
jgi:hypothetical protein